MSDNRIYRFLYYCLFLLTVAFILIYAQKINYIQNDEWVHYETLKNFINKDYILDRNIGSTFYSQAFLAYLFTASFGISNVPILTAIVSILTYIIFVLILKNKNLFENREILSLILFLNPIFIYLSLGFMIENYFLLFIVISYYFYVLYQKKQSGIYLILATLSAILAFFTKQFGVVYLIGLGIHLLLFGKKRQSAYVFVITVVIVLYYYLFFPRTPIMLEQGFNFGLISNPVNAFKITVGWLFTLTAFTLPIGLFIVFAETITLFKKKNTSRIYSQIYIRKFIARLDFRRLFLIVMYLIKLIMVTIILIGFVYTFSFIFPNLENTFTSKGFFPGDLTGNKYQFIGWWDTFNLWKWLTVLAFISNLVIVLRTKIQSFPFLFFLLFFSFLLVSPYFFDRYLIIILPFYLMLQYKLIKRYNYGFILKLLVSSFLFFLLCLNYLYVNDFVLWQNYVNQRSKDIWFTNKSDEKCVFSTRALNKINCPSKANYDWFFTFDSPEVVNSEKMELRNTYSVDFIGNLFINSNIYLYEVKK